jgi:curved DNA-binding protein
VEFRDYYSDLGVPPDADEAAIKRAYRKPAREHHPDVNPNDKSAEERFKIINEAYEALSDPERRRKYDELRQQYQRWKQRGGTGDFNWEQWQAPPGGYGGYTREVSPEDLEDLFGEESPFSDFFSSIFGGAPGRGGRTRAARPRPGRDIEAVVEISMEEAFHGAARSIEVRDRRINARIPAGVRTGSRVRLQGQGEPGIRGGAAGDLYLIVEVQPHPRFSMEGEDLVTVVPIDFYTAAAGGEVRVETLDGAVKLKVPPRTQAGRTFRLRGQGMPRAVRSSERGDLIARIEIVLPEPLSDTELEELRKMAARRSGRRG